MVRSRSIRAVPLALAAGMLFAQPAQAALGTMAMPMAVTSALAVVDTCPAVAAAAPSAAVTGPSKAGALLGGQVSQLELMRQQQAGIAPAAAPIVAGLASGRLPEPGAGGLSVPSTRNSACSAGFGLAVPAPRFGAAPLLPATAAPDAILASKRLAIRTTPFDREWNRVRGSGLTKSAGRAVFGREQGTLSLATLSAVNSWANAEIRYVEDRELYGQADRWATAGETLRRRAGDCEDIAIVKMQLLASRGIDREDMQLVIARDLVRGSDHAVLVVRIEDRNWLLDNATDELLDASLSYDYRPIMSFSQGNKWIHGY
jgi:predicted transglutaminase-like cysteine proteinase